MTQVATLQKSGRSYIESQQGNRDSLLSKGAKEHHVYMALLYMIKTFLQCYSCTTRRINTCLCMNIFCPRKFFRRKTAVYAVFSSSPRLVTVQVPYTWENCVQPRCEWPRSEKDALLQNSGVSWIFQPLSKLLANEFYGLGIDGQNSLSLG